MKTYTLSIAPDDGQGTQTVVNLQLDNGQPTITGLHLVALDNTGLSTNRLPAINLELLLAAITPATTPSAPAAPTAPAIAATSAPALPSTASGLDAPSTPALNAPPTETNPTRRRATKTSRSVAKAAPTTRKKAATAKTAGKKAASSSAKAKAAPPKAAKAQPTAASSGRTYRTMPEDIATVFAQAKSVAAIADYYQVPRHTATGWIRTARKRGLVPETTRRRRR